MGRETTTIDETGYRWIAVDQEVRERLRERSDPGETLGDVLDQLLVS